MCAKKTKTSGRPPAALYQTIDLHEATGNIAERLDLYKKKIIGSLERFSYVEEGVALSKGTRRDGDDDSA